MKRYLSFIVLGVAGVLAASPALALDIVPNFQNTAGQTWDATRMAVINHAISDWESRIHDNHTVSITFDFAAGDYLGQWTGSGSFPYGTNIYPWTPGIVHTIHFSTTYLSDMYWDPTPSTNDVPFENWDALSVARHELGHALGFDEGFWVNNSGVTNVDRWTSHISGGVFDQGGLNVTMAGLSDLSHVADSGTTFNDLMTPSLYNGDRQEISLLDVRMLVLAHGYDVPEPASLSLLAAAAGVLMLRRRAA